MSYLKTVYVENGDIETPIDYYTCDITGNIIRESDGWYGNNEIHINEDGVKELIDQFLSRNIYIAPFIISMLEEKYTTKKKPNRYIPKRIRDKVFKKYKHACCHCDSAENLEIDHIKPISKGGKNNYENLQILCKTCNLKKSNK